MKVGTHITYLQKTSHTCPKSQFVRGEGTKYKLLYTVIQIIVYSERIHPAV